MTNVSGILNPSNTRSQLLRTISIDEKKEREEKKVRRKNIVIAYINQAARNAKSSRYPSRSSSSNTSEEIRLLSITFKVSTRCFRIVDPKIFNDKFLDQIMTSSQIYGKEH